MRVSFSTWRACRANAFLNVYNAFNIVRFMIDCCDLIRSFAVLVLPKTSAATNVGGAGAGRYIPVIYSNFFDTVEWGNPLIRDEPIKENLLVD